MKPLFIHLQNFSISKETFDTIKNIWRDPVVSKLIANAIQPFLIVVFLRIKSFKDKKIFFNEVKGFWFSKIDTRIFLISILAISFSSNQNLTLIFLTISFFIVLLNFSPPVNKNTTKEFRNEYGPADKSFGIKINTPFNKSIVDSLVEVAVKCEKLPNGEEIMILVYNPTTNVYWPKAIVDFNNDNTWTGSIMIDTNMNERRDIMVASIGKFGKVLIEYFYAGGQKTGLSNNILVNKDFYTHDKITVFVNAKQQ